MLDPGEARGYPSAAYALAFARLENHYFINGGFLDGDGHLLRHMPRIADLPGHIVQGRYDMICPPHTAHRLHQAWRGSSLRMVTAAGHALSEPGHQRRAGGGHGRPARLSEPGERRVAVRPFANGLRGGEAYYPLDMRGRRANRSPIVMRLRPQGPGWWNRG